jgi:hypothetical protein
MLMNINMDNMLININMDNMLININMDNMLINVNTKLTDVPSGFTFPHLCPIIDWGGFRINADMWCSMPWIIPSLLAAPCHYHCHHVMSSQPEHCCSFMLHLLELWNHVCQSFTYTGHRLPHCTVIIYLQLLQGVMFSSSKVS